MDVLRSEGESFSLSEANKAASFAERARQQNAARRAVNNLSICPQ